MNHNIDPPELSSISNQAHKNNTGFCRHYMFLYSLVLGLESKNVLEFGSGFSTTCILKALKLTGGHLTTFEQRRIEEQELWFSKETLEDKKDSWSYIQGDSLTTIPSHPHSPYDLILHDGSHTGAIVTIDINNALPHLKKGGFLLVHDTTHPDLGQEMRHAIRTSNLSDFDHEICTLPYGYGLTLVRLLQSDTPESIEINWRKNS